MPALTLSTGKQIAYASGMFGWSIMNNMITVIMIYFYLPPEGSGMVNLITQASIILGINVMPLLLGGSKLADIIADPLLAHATDSSTNPRGRRIPFMRYWIIPAVVFCALVFMPYSNEESTGNIVWLAITLPLFFVCTTAYAIPYNALLPELARTPKEKLRMSSFQSIGFVSGVGFSSNAFNFAEILRAQMPSLTKMEALQHVVWGLAILGGIAMAIPVLTIDERKYAVNAPATISIRAALKQSLRNRNFRIFIAADFAYYMAIAVITSGLMYYLTVLADLEESSGNMMMITMVAVSLLFYPLINRLALRKGKRIMVVIAFAIMSVVFLAIYALGNLPVSPLVQMYGLMSVFAIPFAILGILPNAIIAEIAEQDALDTGQNNEGMYYAVRLLFDKFGQMFGLSLFAYLTIYGKDQDNDFGLRLNGLVGCLLCIIAGVIFLSFREKRK